MVGARVGIRRGALLPLVLLLFLPLVPARGEVVRVVIDRREEVLGGHLWGEAGAYEKLVGRIFFAFDPESPFNGQVVDLEWAPVNGDGQVEAWADFMVLQPIDPSGRRGVGWLEVSNRGGKASLRYFNSASGRSLDPATAADFGDGLLLREGFTIIWIGWQWDVPDGDDLLRLHSPVARLPEGMRSGLVRADWTVDETTDGLGLGHRGHRSYVPVSEDHPDHVLTVRDGRMAPREVIPREAWSFVAAEDGPQAGQLTGVGLEGGFQAGRIYELVYRAQDPRVVGLGLAVVRDVMSYAKYELESLFPVDRGVAFGVSQTGRFLRQFVYQGFNTDEGGRKAFDGMLIHTAGAGRGSFNHRFGQPSRDGHRYSAFFYPTDLFPFTSRTQKDDVTGREESLFSRQMADNLPLIFYTNTGYEYWGRAASLIHTSVDGTQDVDPRDNERIYHLAGGQHFVGGFPPTEASLMSDGAVPAYRGNPLNFLFTLRALGMRLVDWVEGTEDPPTSAFPSIAEGSLVPPAGMAFPSLPGVGVPGVIHEAYRVDYGPRWWSEGIIDREPPELGPPFLSQVSQVDGFGNEIGGVRGVELRVPVATFAPWNLREGYPGSQEELTDFLGTFIPLSRTDEEREARGDPRPSLESLYINRAVYLERVRAATRNLVREGFLLPEDAPRAVELAEFRWAWVAGGEG
jgi:hypothetical protein